ncbi:hypothetical protein ACLOJK_006279 [Asimina triloba]
MTLIFRPRSFDAAGAESSPPGSNDGEEDEEEEGEENDEYFANPASSEEIRARADQRQQQFSVMAIVVSALRKSLVTCSVDTDDMCSMDISWPTDVRHTAHVTFDRFNGFLGLPVEFQPEVPRRVPSASVSVFGVSPKSMQCSYDRRGNSVPTILLLMQKRLYSQGGLLLEGIFRINAENSQEEHVRNQLNKGIIPHGIDLHCLAGLIKGNGIDLGWWYLLILLPHLPSQAKGLDLVVVIPSVSNGILWMSLPDMAWFRELPSGILDSLAPEQVMRCNTEEQCAQLVTSLPPMEAALLDWAINLMADVVQQEEHNKMNARNIAMVFAPNMTQARNYQVGITGIYFLQPFSGKLTSQSYLSPGDVPIGPTVPPDMAHALHVALISVAAVGFQHITLTSKILSFMQMADPLTALIHAVQVMNFLKTLILRILREREELSGESRLLSSCLDSPSSKDKQSPSDSMLQISIDLNEEKSDTCWSDNTALGKFLSDRDRAASDSEESFRSFQTKSEVDEERELISEGSSRAKHGMVSMENGRRGGYSGSDIEGFLDRLRFKKGVRKICRHPVFQLSKLVKKSASLGVVHSRGSGGEAWA